MSLTTRINLTSLLMDAFFFCAWAGVPFLVRSEPALYLSDGELGTLRATSSLLYVTGSFGLSKLWLRMNLALVARVAALATGLLLVAASLAPSLWILLPCLVLGTFALSAFWPALMALVGEARTGSLVTRIATFNCWWSVGKAAAFLGAGSLLELFDRPSDVLMVTGAGAGLLVFLVPSVRTTTSAVAKADNHPDVPEETGFETWFRAGLFGIFAGWFVSGTMETHFPEGYGRPRFSESFGDAYAFGINALLFAYFAGQAGMFFALRFWTSWPKKRLPYLLVTALLPLSFLIQMVTLSPIVWALSLFLAGATASYHYAQSLFHAQAGRPDKVRRSGIHEGTLSSGSMSGALLVGFALQSLGADKPPLWILFAVASLAWLGTAYWLRKPSGP